MTKTTGLLARVLLLGAMCAAAIAPAGAHPNHWDPSGMTIVQSLPLPGGLLPQSATAAAPSTPAERAAAGCPTSIPRSTVDREPDEQDGFRVHVIYLVPSNNWDRGYDTDGSIECSLRAMQEWMRQQTGTQEWRFDTFIHEGQELIDVTYVKSSKPYTALNNAEGVSAEIQAKLGPLSLFKRYLTFSEARGGACGDAYYPISFNNNREDGKYAQVYLRETACQANDFGVPGDAGMAEMIAQQEIMHNDGMVPIPAPHGCGPPPSTGLGHVCTALAGAYLDLVGLDPEGPDVMFPFVNQPLKNKVLDIGRDDYYRHGRPTRDFRTSVFLRNV